MIVDADIVLSEEVHGAIVKLLQFNFPLLLLPDHSLPEVHPVTQQILPHNGLCLQLHVELVNSKYKLCHRKLSR